MTPGKQSASEVRVYLALDSLTQLANWGRAAGHLLNLGETLQQDVRNQLEETIEGWRGQTGHPIREVAILLNHIMAVQWESENPNTAAEEKWLDGDRVLENPKVLHAWLRQCDDILKQLDWNEATNPDEVNRHLHYVLHVMLSELRQQLAIDLNTRLVRRTVRFTE